MNHFKHIPVLLNQAIEYLQITQGKKYIDATIGGGGHTIQILKRRGEVLGIDQDYDAVDYIDGALQKYISQKQLKVVKGNFKDIRLIAENEHFKPVSGILFDLGVSSHQLDTKERGFSIKHDSYLDMRMDKDLDITAKDILNSYSEDQLGNIFITFGEEENSMTIARSIVETRRKHSITTTKELRELIEKVVKRKGKINPSTKIFQALRIEVNHEINALKDGLEGALNTLADDGRVVVISFHSLEDRIVKRTFKNWEQKGLGVDLFKKPVVAQTDELLSNPRARSAKLRVFEKSRII